MRIRPAAPGAIGAEVSDVDLVTVTPEQVADIKRALYRDKLVVFRDQRFDEATYVDVARAFGTPQVYFQPNYHHPDHPEIFVSSNQARDGKKFGVAGTGRYWHSDYQFFAEPLPLTFVYPQVFPDKGRETYYVDMVGVLDALPEHLRRLVTGRRAIHDAKWRYKITPADVDRAIIDILDEVAKLVPPLSHPAVIRHPVSGRDALYVSEGFTAGLEDLSAEDNARIMKELFAFIAREEHVHTHPWDEGDVLLWDNRVLIHKASTVPPGQPSVSYRIGVYDGLPFHVTPEAPSLDAPELAAPARPSAASLS